MDSGNYKKHAYVAGILVAACVSFAAVAFGLSNFDQIKHPNGQVAMITVSGEGEVTAVPDIATVTFTVRESAKTVPEAQKLVEAKIKKGLDALKDIGVEEKDTKTQSYNVYPKYEYQQAGVCNSYSCPPSKQVIVGYEASQTTVVKVRKVDQAGEVIGLLGGASITEITGPDFTVDDLDAIQTEAKEIAIKNAKEKAERLAKSLGVSLGAITSFNEDGAYKPVMLYKTEAAMGGAMNQARDTASVTLPQGENVITSRVSITFTIK